MLLLVILLTRDLKVALALSLIPGMGHHYLGEHKKGFILNALFLSSVILQEPGGFYRLPEGMREYKEKAKNFQIFLHIFTLISTYNDYHFYRYDKRIKNMFHMKHVEDSDSKSEGRGR